MSYQFQLGLRRILLIFLHYRKIFSLFVLEKKWDLFVYVHAEELSTGTV